MNSQWADYAITAVSYDSDHDHIERLETRKDSGSTLDSAVVKTRQNVVSLINSGTTFVTAFQNNNGDWRKGDDVGVVRINEVDYLRTDGNSRASDNLGELPEF